MTRKPASFARAYESINRRLRIQVEISRAFSSLEPPADVITKSFKAIWDTGSTDTVITERVVEQCKLKCTGKVQMHGTKGPRIAKANNYEVFKEYVDKGESGTVSERPELQELLNDARRGMFKREKLCYEVNEEEAF